MLKIKSILATLTLCSFGVAQDNTVTTDRYSTNVQTLITNDTSVTSGKTFDYVIAGGGLSGLTVANKLSGKGYSVLVIEAGLDLINNTNISTAGLVGNLQNTPAVDCNWHYQASFENGTHIPILVDSGKCLGGSSSINGMVFYRPTAAELDGFETLGNPGWNSKCLFCYMDQVERFTPPNAVQISQGANYVRSVHGFNGQVNTSFPTPMVIPDAQAVYKVAMSNTFNISLSPDMSYRIGSVLASVVWTIWYDAVANINRRSSAAWAFLYAKDQQRSTLTVLTNHIVGRVTFSGYTATGLSFGKASGGALYTVKARKEVILAAGSLGSPPILERSGIGATAILNKFSIPQLVNLPGVGVNLHDQPGTGLSALLNAANNSNPLLVNNSNIFAPIITLPNINQLFGRNVGTTLGAQLESTVVPRANAAVTAGAAANLAGATLLFQTITNLIVKKQMPIAEIIGEAYPGVMTAIFWPLTPLSRGYIHINSSDPFARPRIVPRFLTDDFDVSVAVQAAKKSRAMFESPAFSSLIATAVIDAVPDNSTDAAWAEWYKETSFGASHWVGSNAMLPRALGGVVNPKLQVYGVTGLRIVDFSIIPYQVTSHAMTLAYATALKASDLILADA
ncbi:alcohol oxidase [Meredithblackwellia eburnea MCA 4105]